MFPYHEDSVLYVKAAQKLVGFMCVSFQFSTKDNASSLWPSNEDFFLIVLQVKDVM